MNEHARHFDTTNANPRRDMICALDEMKLL
jgi:hypothetical protein